jgi:hypothetical protein
MEVPKVECMSQRSSHHPIEKINRPPTMIDLVRARGNLLLGLVLVLLIINGGAG